MLWRVDAVLILIAMSAICFGAGVIIFQEMRIKSAKSDTQKDNPVAVASDEQLQLGSASLVEGSDVVRLSLMTEGDSGKFGSSGESRETRNILFVESGQKSARWLLPDNKHRLGELFEIYQKPESDSAKTIATAVVITPKDSDSLNEGKLLLFDPAGKRVSEISKGVRRIELATLSGPDILIVYQRGSRLVRATFDPDSLARRSEQEIDIPKLK